MSRMVIDDEIGSCLEKLHPKPKGRHGKDDRLFMEAICWMLRTGVICHRTMVTGKVFTTVIITGRKKVISRQYWRN